MDKKSAYNAALQLAKQGELSAARKLLDAYKNDPRIKKLYDKIVEQERKQTDEAPKRKRDTLDQRKAKPKNDDKPKEDENLAAGCIGLIVLVVIIGGILAFLPSGEPEEAVQAATSAPLYTPAAQDTPSDTEQLFDETQRWAQILVSQPEVILVFLADIRTDNETGFPIIYADLLVNIGANNAQTADKIRQSAILFLEEPNIASMGLKLDDNFNAVTFWQGENREWLVDELTSYNATREAGRPPTPTPAPPTPRPRPPQPSYSGSSGSSSDSSCSCNRNSLNCADFSRQSSAQRCLNTCMSQGVGDIHQLDGDNDGIACESTR